MITQTLLTALMAFAISGMMSNVMAANATSTTPTQIELLAQAAHVSPETIKARLSQLGVNVQNASDSIFVLLNGDAKKHAKVIAAVLNPQQDGR